jgi:hypothetical protein
MAGRYDNPIFRTGPPGYIGWRNRFLAIDSWAFYTLQIRALVPAAIVPFPFPSVGKINISLLSPTAGRGGGWGRWGWGVGGWGRGGGGGRWTEVGTGGFYRE